MAAWLIPGQGLVPSVGVPGLPAQTKEDAYAMIEVESLSKRYGETLAVDGRVFPEDEPTAGHSFGVAG